MIPLLPWVPAILAGLTLAGLTGHDYDDDDDDYGDYTEHSKAKPFQDPNLVTIQQASRMLGVSEKTIRRRIKDKTFGTTLVVRPEEKSSLIGIRLDDIRKWAKANGKPIMGVGTAQDAQAKKIINNLIKDPDSLNLMIELTKSNIEICDLKIEEMEHKAKKANEDASEDFTSKIIEEKIKRARLKQSLMTYEAALKKLESQKQSGTTPEST